MSKRTKLVIKSKEADALRKLREMRGLSVRKMGDLLGMSHTMVNHLEVGRANITAVYIQKFLKALNYREEEWQKLLLGQVKSRDVEAKRIRKECLEKARSLSEDKLKMLNSFMSNL